MGSEQLFNSGEDNQSDLESHEDLIQILKIHLNSQPPVWPNYKRVTSEDILAQLVTWPKQKRTFISNWFLINDFFFPSLIWSPSWRLSSRTWTTQLWPSQASSLREISAYGYQSAVSSFCLPWRRHDSPIHNPLQKLLFPCSCSCNALIPRWWHFITHKNTR
jgi:hypothetical protein